MKHIYLIRPVVLRRPGFQPQKYGMASSESRELLADTVEVSCFEETAVPIPPTPGKKIVFEAVTSLRKNLGQWWRIYGTRARGGTHSSLCGHAHCRSSTEFVTREGHRARLLPRSGQGQPPEKTLLMRGGLVTLPMLNQQHQLRLSSFIPEQFFVCCDIHFVPQERVRPRISCKRWNFTAGFYSLTLLIRTNKHVIGLGKNERHMFALTNMVSFPKGWQQ